MSVLVLLVGRPDSRHVHQEPRSAHVPRGEVNVRRGVGGDGRGGAAERGTLGVGLPIDVRYGLRRACLAGAGRLDDA